MKPQIDSDIFPMWIFLGKSLNRWKDIIAVNQLRDDLKLLSISWEKSLLK